MTLSDQISMAQIRVQNMIEAANATTPQQPWTTPERLAERIVEAVTEEIGDEAERLCKALMERTEEQHVMGRPGALDWLMWARDLLASDEEQQA